MDVLQIYFSSLVLMHFLILMYVAYVHVSTFVFLTFLSYLLHLFVKETIFIAEL